MASDPMFKLDHMGDDVKKMKDLEPVMNNLEQFQKRKKDDYELNSILRKKFRVSEQPASISIKHELCFKRFYRP